MGLALDIFNPFQLMKKKFQSHGPSIYKWVEKTLNGLRRVEKEIQSDAPLDSQEDHTSLNDLLLLLDDMWSKVVYVPSEQQIV